MELTTFDMRNITRLLRSVRNSINNIIDQYETLPLCPDFSAWIAASLEESYDGYIKVRADPDELFKLYISLPKWELGEVMEIEFIESETNESP